MAYSTQQLRIPFSHISSDGRTDKLQILLSATGTLDSAAQWAHLPRSPFTLPAYIVDRDGTVLQLFSPDYYSHYPALSDSADTRIIAIALANAGPLYRLGNRCYLVAYDEHNMPVADTAHPVRTLYEYCTCAPYRGFGYYEMFPDAQLRSLRPLLAYLLRRFAISHSYDIAYGDLTPRLRRNIPGIYLNSGYAANRLDPHPQPELLKILKNLSSL